MKEPTHVDSETVYYMVILWPIDRKAMGKRIETAYKTRKSAYQAMKRHLDNSKEYRGATIRREVVFVRNEHTEISDSTPIAQYDVLRAVWS